MRASTTQVRLWIKRNRSARFGSQWLKSTYLFSGLKMFLLDFQIMVDFSDVFGPLNFIASLRQWPLDLCLVGMIDSGSWVHATDLWSTKLFYFYHGHILIYNVLLSEGPVGIWSGGIPSGQVPPVRRHTLQEMCDSSCWFFLLEGCTSLINEIWKPLFPLICMRELGKGPTRIMRALVPFIWSHTAVTELHVDSAVTTTFNMEIIL